MFAKHIKSPHRSIAKFEALEVRRLLATVIVNTLADETLANLTTSLREAISMAAAGDSIAFATSLAGTVTLADGELVIDKGLSITGPGWSKVTVSGNDASRVFR